MVELILGSRTSKLALWQTNYAIERLQGDWPGLVCRVRPIVTSGDKNQQQPLPEIGGKGLFTAELEQALLDKEIDCAVHSLKDLPVEDSPGLALGAIFGRTDARDALIARQSTSLADLPPAARVGTSSLRRQAQLRAARPDLLIEPMRGNVDTRLRKVFDGEYDAAVLAAAGLERLNLAQHIREHLPLTVMLPAPGQGALAIQCRQDDANTLALLAAVDEADLRAAVTAERTFLQALGGGCSAPIAAYAAWDSGRLHLQGLVASLDGRQIIRVVNSGGDGLALGTTLAQEALAKGAQALLPSSSHPQIL